VELTVTESSRKRRLLNDVTDIAGVSF